MTTKRRYNRKEKLAAIMAAEMGGVTQAGEQTGIPKTTIQYWLGRPEFAQFRTRTREELIEEIKTVAHLAWQRTAEALQAGTIEPRDILFAAEKATNLQLLMRGEATNRIESVSITDGLDDHEREVLSTVIRDELARRAESPAAKPAVGDPVAAGAEGT